MSGLNADGIRKGSQNISVYLVIRKSADNTERTGLLYNSSGLKATYVRDGSAAQAITLATLASASAAHSDGGFIEVDSTNSPGLYRLDVPDAAFASGADRVTVAVGGTSGDYWSYEHFKLTGVVDSTGKSVTDGKATIDKIWKTLAPIESQVSSPQGSNTETKAWLSDNTWVEQGDLLIWPDRYNRVLVTVVTNPDDEGYTVWSPELPDPPVQAQNVWVIHNNVFTDLHYLPIPTSPAAATDSVHDRVKADVTVGGFTTAAKAEVQTECEDAISAQGLTSTDVENAVWDAETAGHTTTGSFGKKVGDL